MSYHVWKWRYSSKRAGHFFASDLSNAFVCYEISAEQRAGFTSCVPISEGIPTPQPREAKCQFNNCLNGGRCVADGGGIGGRTRCDCTGTGYTGATCVEDVNECLEQPCQNGGQCVNQVGTPQITIKPPNAPIKLFSVSFLVYYTYHRVQAEKRTFHMLLGIFEDVFRNYYKTKVGERRT